MPRTPVTTDTGSSVSTRAWARKMADGDAPAQDAVSEAMLALKSLGYTPQEAANALKGVKGQGSTADELIRLALRQMAQNS